MVGWLSIPPQPSLPDHAATHTYADDITSCQLAGRGIYSKTFYSSRRHVTTTAASSTPHAIAITPRPCNATP